MRVLDGIAFQARHVVVEIYPDGTIRDTTSTNGAPQRILQTHSDGRPVSAITGNQDVFDNWPDERVPAELSIRMPTWTTGWRDLDITESDHGDPVVRSDEREGRIRARRNPDHLSERLSEETAEEICLLRWPTSCRRCHRYQPGTRRDKPRPCRPTESQSLRP